MKKVVFIICAVLMCNSLFALSTQQGSQQSNTTKNFGKKK